MEHLRSLDADLFLAAGLETALWDHMTELNVRVKTTLLKQGKTDDRFFYIVRGTVVAWYEDLDMLRYVTRIYREGEIVIFRSFLEHEPSPVTLVSLSGSLLLELNFQKCLVLAEAYPNLQMALNAAVNYYDQLHEQRRNFLCSRERETKVDCFYKLFPMLRAVRFFRFDDILSAYLQVSRRTLLRYRKMLFSA